MDQSIKLQCCREMTECNYYRYCITVLSKNRGDQLIIPMFMDIALIFTIFPNRIAPFVGQSFNCSLTLLSRCRCIT